MRDKNKKESNYGTCSTSTDMFLRSPTRTAPHLFGCQEQNNFFNQTSHEQINYSGPSPSKVAPMLRELFYNLKFSGLDSFCFWRYDSDNKDKFLIKDDQYSKHASDIIRMYILNNDFVFKVAPTYFNNPSNFTQVAYSRNFLPFDMTDEIRDMNVINDNVHKLVYSYKAQLKDNNLSTADVVRLIFCMQNFVEILHYTFDKLDDNAYGNCIKKYTTYKHEHNNAKDEDIRGLKEGLLKLLQHVPYNFMDTRTLPFTNLADMVEAYVDWITVKADKGNLNKIYTILDNMRSFIQADKNIQDNEDKSF